MFEKRVILYYPYDSKLRASKVLISLFWVLCGCQFIGILICINRMPLGIAIRPMTAVFFFTTSSLAIMAFAVFTTIYGFYVMRRRVVASMSFLLITVLFCGVLILPGSIVVWNKYAAYRGVIFGD